MKRPAARLALLGIGVYLAGLIVFFPATLAIRWFVPSTPGLALGAADGTVWNGRLAGVTYRGLDLGAAEWTLHPLALLGLAASADVALERASGERMLASIRATLAGDVAISGLRGSVSLAELARAKLLPANIATGDVILDLQQLDVQNSRPVAAAGRVGLTNLQSALLPGIALGSYEGNVETTDAGIAATFRELDAPLRVAGKLELRPDGAYNVSGSITPVAETPDALRRGLALLGQSDPSGSYAFGFSGTL